MSFSILLFAAFKVCCSHTVYSWYLLIYSVWLECLVLLSLIYHLTWLDVGMPHCYLFSICHIYILLLSSCFPSFILFEFFQDSVLSLLLPFCLQPFESCAYVVSLGTMIGIFSLSESTLSSYKTPRKMY